MLAEAAIRGKIDPLIGLKENVIIGKLIPAGTGMKRYRSIHLDSDIDENAELDVDDLMGEDIFTEEDVEINETDLDSDNDVTDEIPVEETVTEE